MFRFRLRTYINGNWYTAYRRDAIRKLKTIGAYTRTSMRDMLRKKKGPSAPGEAPHVHSNKLKGAIRFAVDEMALSSVTGPMTAGSGVARIIDEGGPTRITGGKHSGEAYTAQPRPYRAPALAKTLPAIARILKD